MTQTTNDAAVLEATTHSSIYERRLVLDTLRSSPFVQCIGKSWPGARLLIQVSDGEDLESVVNHVRTIVTHRTGIHYRRYA